MSLKLAYRMFEAAKRAYYEYEHSHNPPTPPGQWDYSFRCGPAGFYVLDMRGHRRYGAPKGERILGAAQMKRFKDWIAAKSDAQVLFVISPVPVVHTASYILNWVDLPFSTLKDDVRDHWEHPRHLAERDRLLQTVFENSQATKRHVIFISGDVHVAAASKLSHPEYTNAAVYQITASGITYADLSDFMRAAVKLTIRKRGTLAVDNKNGSTKRPYHFETLHVLGRNNFGIFRVSPGSANGVQVRYDLYGKSNVPGAVLRLKRLEL